MIQTDLDHWSWSSRITIKDTCRCLIFFCTGLHFDCQLSPAWFGMIAHLHIMWWLWASSNIVIGILWKPILALNGWYWQLNCVSCFLRCNFKTESTLYRGTKSTLFLGFGASLSSQQTTSLLVLLWCMIQWSPPCLQQLASVILGHKKTCYTSYKSF